MLNTLTEQSVRIISRVGAKKSISFKKREASEMEPLF